MKHYAIGELEVTDPSWVEEYLREVTPIVARFGGKYLARNADSERLEGDRPLPHVMVILDFPDKESAVRFYESDEYAPYLRRRQAGARGQFVLVPGQDTMNPAA